jgi:hypothetical protein
MWTGFGFAEELCTADAAKPPMHPAAAIGDGLKIGEYTFDGYRFGWKASIDGPAAGSEVLAETAPTDPCDDRRSRGLIANGSAQTPSSDQHWSVTSKPRRLIVRSVC